MYGITHNRVVTRSRSMHRPVHDGVVAGAGTVQHGMMVVMMMIMVLA